VAGETTTTLAVSDVARACIDLQQSIAKSAHVVRAFFNELLNVPAFGVVSASLYVQLQDRQRFNRYQEVAGDFLTFL